MRGVGNSTNYDPGASPRDVEKTYPCFPPGLRFAAEPGQPLAGVGRVAPNELEPGFRLRQRRRADIDAQYVPKPEILADALMHHVLQDAPTTAITGVGPDREVLVAERGPGTQHLDPLGGVGIYQKGIPHGALRGC